MKAKITHQLLKSLKATGSVEFFLTLRLDGSAVGHCGTPPASGLVRRFLVVGAASIRLESCVCPAYE